jgi:recombination protein RecT
LIAPCASDSNLQSCAPGAIIKEALKGALLKLPINKNLGFAYVIAYKGKPDFQMGYKGYVQLALRTGNYKILHCDEVYEGEYKTRNKLTGEFDLTGQAANDNVVGYFAYMELHNGFSKTLYMSKEKVLAHAKKYSPSFTQANGPWTKEFNAMAKKTVLKNLLTHWGILSVEMITALESDDVSEQVQDEINRNGNSQNMDFQDADVVSNTNGAGSQTMDFANQTGPGF